VAVDSDCLSIFNLQGCHGMSDFFLHSQRLQQLSLSSKLSRSLTLNLSDLRSLELHRVLIPSGFLDSVLLCRALSDLSLSLCTGMHQDLCVSHPLLRRASFNTIKNVSSMSFPSCPCLEEVRVSMLPRLNMLSLGPGHQVRDGDGDCDENQEVIVVPLCVVARMCPKLKSVTLTQPRTLSSLITDTSQTGGFGAAALHVDETHIVVMPVSRGTVPDSSDPLGPHVSSRLEGDDEVRRPVVFHSYECCFSGLCEICVNV
jgi:hypothetical protein